MKKIFLLSFGLLVACSNQEEIRQNGLVDSEANLKQQQIEEHVSKFVPNDFDRFAKRLAGLPCMWDRMLDMEYEEYRRDIDIAWGKLQESSLAHVRPWAEKNIDDKIAYCSRLFYPFGGPDIAYALEFFPNCDDYVLVGLEPIGSFESIVRLIEGRRYDKIYNALDHFLEKGYFVTSYMKNDLSKQGAHGCLAMLVFQVAKLGYNIVSIEDIGLNLNGRCPIENALIRGIKISIESSVNFKAKDVYYFRVDLNNNNHNGVAALTKFVRAKDFGTFIKSSSYILFNNKFSDARAFILNNAKFVLQDDTGIPFKYLSNYHKYAFGQYTEPTLNVFKDHAQSDLRSFFDSSKPASINFKIGYGFMQGRPNLLLGISTDKNNEPHISHVKKN